MELVINGERRRFDDDRVETVDELVDALEIESTDGTAVAVGDEVVPRGRWDDRRLQEGDRVEIIRAAQGG